MEFEKQFENEQVSVVKVKTAPYEKIGLHRNSNPRIVVGLKGGTITRFESDGTITHLDFPTGQAVFRPADEENCFHRSMNDSSEPLELMMIHLKTSFDSSPQYLYKILSIGAWEQSQGQDCIILSDDDDSFIHFSKEDQLERIITKYWSDVPEYVILKIDIHHLTGRLVYETNPGGISKYFHLYEGSIPHRAVVESKVMKKNDLGICS